MSLARPLVMRVLALRETMSRMGRLSLYRCQRLNTALSCPSLALVCVAMREIIVRFARRMEVTEVLGAQPAVSIQGLSAIISGKNGIGFNALLTDGVYDRLFNF